MIPAHLRHPRYWPTWALLGLLRFVAVLPFPWLLKIGRGLGTLGFHLAGRRRHITLTNLRICFPEFSEEKVRTTGLQSFQSLGMGFMETVAAWWKPQESFRPRVTLKGQKHLENALRQSKGVLLLSGHFSTLDFGGALLSLFHKADAVYRRQNNPVLDHILLHHRKRFSSQPIEREDMKTLVRRLRSNLVWIAADQDPGPLHSVFAPFFGQQAATHTSVPRLARMGKAPVVFLAAHRTDNRGQYLLEFFPALEGYPSKDPQQDAARTNKLLEDAIRRYPEQYYWLHRRFKTQPDGAKAELYRRDD